MGKKKSYYAVKKGRNTGIYKTWDECKAQVNGYSGAEYKSFTTLEEAQDFIEEKKVIQKVEGKSLLAYVDGSYNIRTQQYGYGCVILKENEVIAKLNGKGYNEENASMRNVAGEILGSKMAINYAIENGYDSIAIYYDYEGIAKWPDGEWKATKESTQEYRDYVNFKRKKININFYKVLAHSGDTYNDLADELAKQAVGLL